MLDVQTPQDSWTVAAILKDVLKQVHHEVATVDSVYICSDNAGCYHGSKKVAMVPHISAVSDIEIKHWDFSEPQSGKGHVTEWLHGIRERSMLLFLKVTQPRHLNSFLMQLLMVATKGFL